MTAQLPQPRIAVIGAGFSGLSAAWALSKQGFAVEIFEKKTRAGGLISTEKSTVLVESAANAILANLHVEELFADIGVQAIKSGHKSNKRWIYRDGAPSRFPLKWHETALTIKNLVQSRRHQRLKPGTDETVAQWGSRCLSPAAVQYLISPALQGIYATTADNLSAELIVGSMLRKSEKTPRGELRGSVSAKGGMQEIIDKLSLWLQSRGVKIHFSQDKKIAELQKDFLSVIVATSHTQAVEILEESAPELTTLLRRVPSLSLNTCILGFKSAPLRGFGCLFPREEGFRSLGVLFNSDIFSGRGRGRNESWIIGGELSSDEEAVSLALADRRRLTKNEEAPRFQRVHRHGRVLPLYGFELRNFLRSGVITADKKVREIEFPVYLTGNYFGAIGLGKILARNHRLAQHLAQELL